jgi:Na+(H+)/acetate symporter ActP
MICPFVFFLFVIFFTTTTMRHCRTISLVCLLFISFCQCYLQPPASTVAVSATVTATRSTPTAAPLAKRDDESDLDLYQAWASMCKSGVNNNALIASASVGDVNNLWKTVTQTVNCGKGSAVTVTATVSASASGIFTCATSTPSKIKSCTGQCWSDYLWRKEKYCIFFFF